MFDPKFYYVCFSLRTATKQGDGSFLSIVSGSPSITEWKNAAVKQSMESAPDVDQNSIVITFFSLVDRGFAEQYVKDSGEDESLETYLEDMKRKVEEGETISPKVKEGDQ